VIISVFAPPEWDTRVGLGGSGRLGSAAEASGGLAARSPQPSSASSAAEAQNLVGIIGPGD
jgi:hypothetical protein